MSEITLWLLVSLFLYSVYVVYVGVGSAAASNDPKSFFLADRNLPAWVYVLAATAVSTGGWLMFGQVDIVAREGLPFAQVALGTILIALGGTVVLKRQWMLSRRYGFVTPAEMFGEYFGGEVVRILVVIIALFMAIPFVGLQLLGAAQIVSTISGGWLDPILTMWAMGVVVFVSVSFGGIRAAAYAAVLQAMLILAGIIGAGVFAFVSVGGIEPLSNLAVAAGSATSDGTAVSYLEIPGVIHFLRGLGVDQPIGGTWTTTLTLSYCIALMGFQLSPAFSILAYSARSPKGFAIQQTWGGAGAVGGSLILFGFVIALVFGAGDPSVFGNLGTTLAPLAPWFAALLAVAIVASAQAVAALGLSATSTMIVRDVLRRYLLPEMDVNGQRFFARILMALIVVTTLLVASFGGTTQGLLGSIALALSVQLLPAFVAMLWLRWITPPAVITGLVLGMVAVILTDSYGLALGHFFGLDLPWGRWPGSIHSAAWGLAVNAVVCLVVSLVSQRQEDVARRARYHDFLWSHAGAPANRHTLKPVAWAVTLAWLFFAIGPGALFGNAAFGDPSSEVASWSLGIPSLLAWQGMWWGLGVLLIWFLSWRMQMSTRPAQRIELVPRSERPSSISAFAGTATAQRWFLVLCGGAAAVTFANWLFT